MRNNADLNWCVMRYFIKNRCRGAIPQNDEFIYTVYIRERLCGLFFPLSLFSFSFVDSV